MLWVGLTGCMGCGKSTLGAYYKSLGYPVISADEVVKSLYQDQSVVDEIKKEFLIDQDLDTDELKTLLAKTVFKDKNKLLSLEKILHPKIRKKILEIKASLTSKIAFYDVPLLFEKNMQDQFDYIICVGLDERTQKERIKLRNDSWSDEEIENRIKNQVSIEKKKEGSDFYINNEGDLNDLHKQSDKILNYLLSIP